MAAPRFKASADYIVVGAGPDRHPMIHVPMGIRWVVGNPATDWCYRTQPERELHGRSLIFPRGKTLGGTSAINGPAPEGLGCFDSNRLHGKRQSTAVAFLRPAMRRGNLRVETGAAAARILFEARRAVGVEYLQRGKTVRARAGREVILSCGVVNSPQLLMLSGVGPAEELRALGIAVVHDAAQVGRNLQDHLDVNMQFECLQAVTYYRWTSRHRKLLAALRWGLFKSGLASELLLPIGGFLRSRPEIALPDIQLHLILALPGRDGQREPDREGFGVHICNLQPDSVGRVRLVSADSRVAPAIEPNFLSAPNDILPIRAGMRIVRKLLQAPSMQSFRGLELAPGPEAVQDAALDEFVRRTALTVFHPTSTCRMGADASSVVDPTLNVRGVETLRIVDASVMPRVPRANTNAPIPTRRPS